MPDRGLKIRTVLPKSRRMATLTAVMTYWQYAKNNLYFSAFTRNYLVTGDMKNILDRLPWEGHLKLQSLSINLQQWLKRTSFFTFLYAEVSQALEWKDLCPQTLKDNQWADTHSTVKHAFHLFERGLEEEMKRILFSVKWFCARSLYNFLTKTTSCQWTWHDKPHLQDIHKCGAHTPQSPPLAWTALHWKTYRPTAGLNITHAVKWDTCLLS